MQGTVAQADDRSYGKVQVTNRPGVATGAGAIGVPVAHGMTSGDGSRESEWT